MDIFCHAVDHIVLHTSHTRLDSVPEMIHLHVHMQEYGLSWLNVALSDIDQGFLSIVFCHPWQSAQLCSVLSVPYPSLVDYSSYRRIRSPSNSFSFNPRRRQVLLQVSACVSIPRTSDVITVGTHHLRCWSHSALSSVVVVDKPSVMNNKKSGTGYDFLLRHVFHPFPC